MKLKINRFSAFLLLCLLTSCIQTHECQIIQLHRIGGIYQSPTTGKLSKDEFFVITHPPKDTVELLMLLNEYNQRTLPKDSLMKYLPGSYYRAFYNEDSRLYNDYQNDAHFDFDRIYDYANVRLMTFRWHTDTCCTGIHANYASAVYNMSVTHLNISPDSLYNFWMNDKAWK